MPRFPILPLLLAVPALLLAAELEPYEEIGKFADGTVLHGRDLMGSGAADLKGITVHPGVCLKGANLAGRSLAGATLAGVDLRGLDLAGSNLMGANLTGAQVEGANFTLSILFRATLDWRLDPARMVLKDTLDPAGVVLNPSPAPLPRAAPVAPPPSAGGAPRLPAQKPTAQAAQRPEVKEEPVRTGRKWNTPVDLASFFARDLPLGTIKLLSLPEHSLLPRKLVRTEDGIGWLEAGTGHLRTLWPGGRGWLPTRAAVGDGVGTGVPAPKRRPPRGARVIVKVGAPPPSPEKPPALPVALAATPGHLAAYDKDSGDVLIQKTRSGSGAKPGPLEVHRFPLAALRSGPLFDIVDLPGERFLVHTMEAVVLVNAEDPGKGTLNVPLSPDPLRKVLVTRYGHLWYTLPRKTHLARANLADAKTSIFDLAGREAIIGSLAEGEDGSIWYSLPQHNEICRLLPALDQFRSYLLPLPGSAPYQLLDGGDGSLYFTMLGRRRIGRIVIAEPQAKVPPRGRRRGTPLGAWLAKAAEERKAPALPDPGAAAAPPAVAPPPFPPMRAASMEVINRTLEALGVQEVALRHILQEHGYPSGNDKGRFTEEDTRSRSGVLGLICEALAREDYPPIHDIYGFVFIVGEFPGPIGSVKQGGRWEPTNRLKVVLTTDQTRVVSAYPVKDF